MKSIVKGIIGTILGTLYVYFCINGYPSEWIVHGSFLSMGTPILRQLVNSCIFFLLAPLTSLLLGYYKKMNEGVVVKYGILFLAVLFISLIAEFIGHIGDYKFAPTFDVIFFDALANGFLRNASIILSLVLFTKSLTLFPLGKYKDFIIIALSILLYVLVTIIYHIGFSSLAMTYHIAIGFGMGLLTSYFVLNENSLVIPAIFFGLVGITRLPSYYAMDSETQVVTYVILISMYFIVGIIMILAEVYLFTHKSKEVME
ncbi:hypothetical protein EI71_01425 [Anaeroplasma bactoclasticum]|jgi:hypothetical protein|uniref:Uncharacterized protein n=1 Tax=Anaeroplasma bactoclasticum TaxID=2088 RepID=A0A397RSX8_9MOLU|nr:hypothetical protein [Anaeroplasma bactoclasticum]RIA75529.1 hypothetical protein EI71_01425 [Anaeroplasma bactoclasticum]